MRDRTDCPAPPRKRRCMQVASLFWGPAFVGMTLFGIAHAEEGSKTPMPPMLAEYLERTQAEIGFLECVDASAEKQRLTDADLAERIAVAGLADKTYAAVAAELEDPDALLREGGFVPAREESQAAQAEKAMALAKRAMEGDVSTRPALLVSMSINDAIAAGCTPPPHLLPGGDDALRAKVESLAPLMGEAERVRECATAEIEKRGIDEDAAYALLDKAQADDFRARALAAVDAMPGVDPEYRAKLAQSESIGALATRLTLISAMTFDIESLARASGLTALYLDRALDAKCDPSNELRTFIGAAESANR